MQNVYHMLRNVDDEIVQAITRTKSLTVLAGYISILPRVFQAIGSLLLSHVVDLNPICIDLLNGITQYIR